MPLLVEEKVDGSQFSFMLNTDGLLEAASKGAVIDVYGPPKMFQRAVETVITVKDKLQPGWIYRGEVLDKPHHNVLSYERVPKGNIILFDIEPSEGDFLKYEDKARQTSALGMEVVPILHTAMIADMDMFNALLETESVLGGVKVEGIVLKPLGLNLWGVDKKLLMAKFVSEVFKEKHRTEWKGIHGEEGQRTIIERLATALTTEARWHKAVQHGREAGTVVGEPKDIGPLIHAIQADITEEEKDYIKEVLYKWAWKDLSRRVVAGFPSWYKNLLVAQQFKEVVNK